MVMGGSRRARKGSQGKDNEIYLASSCWRSPFSTHGTASWPNVKPSLSLLDTFHPSMGIGTHLPR